MSQNGRTEEPVRPGQREGGEPAEAIELDVHAHLAPVQGDWLAGLQGVRWEPAQELLELDGHRVGVKDLFHPERLIERMDRHGVHRAYVSIPPPLYRQQLPEDEARAWVMGANEALASVARGHAGRLEALMHLPLEHPALLPSMLQAFAAGHWAGFSVAAGGHPAIVFSQAVYEPLWAALHELRAFVFVHPGTSCDTRLAQFYLENLVGNPVETGVAAAHLVMAGVPGRFPSIRFCLAHGGGIFSTLVGRMERGFDTLRPGVDTTVERPLQAARRFAVDGIVHHASLLSHVRAVHGAEQVLYGSDWPFPMGVAGR